jgi:hypothetical protein
MAYQKRRSATLEKAQARLAGLLSAHPNLDLGNGLTLRGYAALIEACTQQLQTHNAALSEADRTRIEFAEAEASVSALSSRLLSAVVAVYGKDSKEYELAGGKPPSSYKRNKQQNLTLTAIESPTGSNTSEPRLNGAIINGAGTVI